MSHRTWANYNLTWSSTSFKLCHNKCVRSGYPIIDCDLMMLLGVYLTAHCIKGKAGDGGRMDVCSIPKSRRSSQKPKQTKTKPITDTRRTAAMPTLQPDRGESSSLIIQHLLRISCRSAGHSATQTQKHNECLQLASPTETLATGSSILHHLN